MELKTLGEVRIIRVDQPLEVVMFSASFVGAYQTVWADPPYNERFYPSEAEAVLRRYLAVPEQVTLLAVRGRAQVVGFGMAVPLHSQPRIARTLRGLLPLEHTFYLSELGVLPGWRQKGLGSALLDLRLDLIDKHRYSHAALRTSARRDFVYDMFRKRGFEDTGVYSEVSFRRTDGSVRSDRRLYLSRMLDKPRAEEGSPPPVPRTGHGTPSSGIMDL